MRGLWLCTVWASAASVDPAVTAMEGVPTIPVLCREENVVIIHALMGHGRWCRNDCDLRRAGAAGSAAHHHFGPSPDNPVTLRIKLLMNKILHQVIW